MKPSSEIRIVQGSERPSNVQGSLSGSSSTDRFPIASSPESKVVVHIVGAVKSPGLYEFEPGKRVSDGIARAGGSKAEADLDAINLAAKLIDGTQLSVPKKSISGSSAEPADETYSPQASAPAYSRSAAGKSSGTTSKASLAPASISLNTASKSELDLLPGVGPSTAQKILDYRRQAGGFSTIDELLSVKGIGPKKLAAMRKYVRL